MARLESYRASSEPHPEFAWSLIIGVFSLGLIIVMIFGYVVYRGAQETKEAEPTDGPKDTMTISASEIEQLVSVYDAKNAEHERLKAIKPDIPNFVGGRNTAKDEDGDPDVDEAPPVP